MKVKAKKLSKLGSICDAIDWQWIYEQILLRLIFIISRCSRETNSKPTIESRFVTDSTNISNGFGRAMTIVYRF